MAVTYEPIASTTLSSSAADVTFSSIPGTYTDLVVVMVGSVTTGTGSLTSSMQVGNGSVDTGSNYSWTNLYGDGSAAGSSRGSTQTYALLGELAGASNTQINPSVGVAHIMSYANTNVYKTILFAGGGGAYVRRAVSLWRSTLAINTVKITSSGTLSSGFTASLFGVKAA